MTFDASAFMEQNVEGPLETALKPVPIGEYLAMIDDFQADEKTFRSVQAQGETKHIFRCPFVIQDEELKAKLGRDKITAYLDIWLDENPDGSLKTGGDANVRLGQLRAAVGQNTEGPWNFSMLRNAGPLRVTIKHRSDKNDPEVKYAEVAKVGKA